MRWATRAGEGALFVAEQFALQQRFRDGGAIDLDERPGGARAPGVDDVGHHFLAHAAFAGDEHAAFGGGNERDIAEKAPASTGWRRRCAGGNCLPASNLSGARWERPVAWRTEASNSSRSIGLER